MKRILGIILFFSALVFSACNDDNGIDPKNEELCENMLYFDSNEEMFKELEMVGKMSLQDLENWEYKKGFKSIEIAAETLYESIEPEQYKSIDEVKRFVQKNSDYLVLINDGNGEFELDTRLGKSPFKYFANHNGVFQIKNSIYKIFENAIISADEDLYEDLINADFVSSLSIPGIKVVYEENDFEKSLKSSCITPVVRVDNGNERIRLIHDADKVNLSGTNIYQVYTRYEARAYKRTGLIWYHAKRIISCDIYFKITYQNTNGDWPSYILLDSNSGEDAYVLEDLKWVGSATPTYNVKLKSYNSWAKQENTNKAISICSVE